MIEFVNVSKSLMGKPVLKGVSFRIEKGDTFVVVGPSGAGKSVTLKHMICLLRPDQGQVLLDGADIGAASSAEVEQIRRRFGVLFQGGALLEWLTVAENVALPLREKTSMPGDEIDHAVFERLKLVGLADDAHKHPSELSGGMRKRAALARALIEKPEIMLYDEPTSGLDPVSARSIDRLIDEMRTGLGVTSVVVTHDLHSALGIGSRIAMLYGGSILEIATPADFVSSGKTEVRQFLESQFITKRGPWERHK